MAEAHRVAVAGLQQVEVDQPLARLLERRAGHVVGEGVDRLELERVAHDRAVRERRTLAVAEPVEPGREQRVQRRRQQADRGGRALILEVGHQLLEEERVAARCPGDVHPRLPLQPAGLEQRRAGRVGERAELEHVARLRAAVRSRHPDDQHRRVLDPAGDGDEQLEQRRLGQVRVVDHHHERLRPSERRDQPRERPAGVVARPPGREADRRRHLVAHRRLDAERGREGVHRALAPGLVDHLAQRPVGDAFAVGRAAARQHPALGADERRQLGGQARLADARLPADRQQRGSALTHDARERRAQPRELLVAADQRAIEAAHDRRRVGVEVGQQKRAARQLRGAGAVAHEPPGRLVDPDLARRGRARLPLGCRGRLADQRGDHVARPDPERERVAAQLQRSPQRAQRVVLVRARRPEREQQLLATHLGDAAAVAGARRGRELAVALQSRAQRLRVGAGERGAHDHAGHAPAHVGRQRRLLRRRRRGDLAWRRIAASSERSSGDGSMPSPSASAA